MVLRKNIILLCALAIIASCNYKTIHVDGLYGSCDFQVPLGWQKSYSADAGEYYFVYSDSGKIYIEVGSAQNFINMNQANLYKLYRENLQKGDRFEVSGIDSNGKYWKNVSWYKVNVGYLDVDSSVKEKYDQCIATFDCD